VAAERADGARIRGAGGGPAGALSWWSAELRRAARASPGFIEVAPPSAEGSIECWARGCGSGYRERSTPGYCGEWWPRSTGYARNHRVALRRFLDDGRLPIHNNWSERELRREAVGRKNWLFVGSDDGGHANATFVSLIASCQLHGIEPVEYLRDLLCLLPSWKAADVLELAPLHWRETVARDHVQKTLTSNAFRRASLGDSDPGSRHS
jgi:Transposase IS66 family/IS66 C-terminal element